MSKTIVDFVQAVGSENIQYQNLNNNTVKYDYKSKAGNGEITFVTDPKNIDSGKSALILWIDKDKYKAALKELQS